MSWEVDGITEANVKAACGGKLRKAIWDLFLAWQGGNITDREAYNLLRMTTKTFQDILDDEAVIIRSGG